MSEEPLGEDQRRERQLAVAGMVACVIVLLIAQLTQRFAVTIPSAQRPHLVMWGLFVLLFGVYLAALRIAIRIRNPRRVVKLTCLFAVLFRGVLLFTVPIQEIDLYRYIWDGNAIASGVDPYRFSPQQVVDASAWASLGDSSLTGVTVRADDPLPKDPLQRLVAVETRSSALGRILRTIHYPELPTPYPPVSQAIFVLAAWTTPDQASLPTHLFVMKAWVVLFDLITVAAVIGLLRFVRLPVGWCLAYAWCPLVLKEFANSGHLDAIAVCLTTVSLWLLIKVPACHQHWRVPMSAGLLGLAVGAKLYPIVLLPVLLAWLVRHCRWRIAGVFATVVGGVSSVVLWPMLGVDRPAEIVVAPPAEISAVPPLPRDLDAQDHLPVSSLQSPAQQASSPASGLEAFLTRWKMNDFLFLIVNENLDPSAARSRQPWFAVVPDQIRMAIVSPIMEHWDIDAATAAFMLSRVLTLGIFSLLTIWFAWMVSRPDAPNGSAALRLLEASFLTLAWFWLLAPTQNPWYWTWCLPLLPFARSRAWLWVSGLVMVYYLRFWLNAHWPEPPGPLGSRHDGASFFDFILVWFEYVPLFAGLLLSAILRRRSDKQ